MTREINLTKDYKTIVDDEDFEYLNQFKWHANDKGYAVRGRNKRQNRIGMHRVILEIKIDRKLLPNEMPDHIDGNPLNNTRSNLRVSTYTQNTRNRSKTSLSTSSKFKGVSKPKNSKKWSAQIKIDKKLIYLGLFDTEEAAARAYDAAAREYFGEFAKLNFPDMTYDLKSVLKTECPSRYSLPSILQK